MSVHSLEPLAHDDPARIAFFAEFEKHHEPTKVHVRTILSGIPQVDEDKIEVDDDTRIYGCRPVRANERKNMYNRLRLYRDDITQYSLSVCPIFQNRMEVHVRFKPGTAPREPMLHVIG